LTTRSAPQGTPATVLRVVDGDTIHVMLDGNEETIRYVGIDTPERRQPGYRAATAANRSYVEGQRVLLEQDVTHRDNFGRLLRYVYLEDGTFVNAEMVAQGWAQPVNYGRDTAYAEEFLALAIDAAANKRGFWSGTSPVDGAMSYGMATRAVDMYTGPATTYRLSGQIDPQIPLTIFGRSPDSRWLQVRPPSRNGGWVRADAVTVNVPVVSIPLGEVEGETLSGGTPVPTATRPPAAATSAPRATSAPDGNAPLGQCPDGCMTPPAPVCNIKGNVSSSGDKIYHMPGGSLYARTTIDPSTGDRWFCSPTEAEAAGFRRSLR
jgi:endonuclease YncB( thermonuclease family)